MERVSALERSPSKRYDVLLRMLLVGDTGVGKTCILKRFANDEFNEQHYTTIGIDFKMKTLDVDGKIVRVQIWDTAGQERFESITQQFYRRAQGIILVYDISHRPTFLSIRKWVKCIHQFAEKNVCVMLLGNKEDKDDLRQVMVKEGSQLAKELNLMFFETSAKFPENLSAVLTTICRKVLQTESKTQNFSDTLSSEESSTCVDNTSVCEQTRNINLDKPSSKLASGVSSNVKICVNEELSNKVVLEDNKNINSNPKENKSCCFLM